MVRFAYLLLVIVKTNQLTFKLVISLCPPRADKIHELIPGEIHVQFLPPPTDTQIGFFSQSL